MSSEPKTYRELNSELNKLYSKLRPKPYKDRWTEDPEVRKRIDEVLDRKYVRLFESDFEPKRSA